MEELYAGTSPGLGAPPPSGAALASAGPMCTCKPVFPIKPIGRTLWFIHRQQKAVEENEMDAMFDCGTNGQKKFQSRGTLRAVYLGRHQPSHALGWLTSQVLAWDLAYPE